MAGLLVALGGALAVRVAVAGAAGATSLRAGLAFATVLAVAAALGRTGTRALLSLRAVAVGVGGIAVLVLPVLLTHRVDDVHPAGGFVGWAAATAVVATAEEAFLRGVLFDAVTRRHGVDLAVVVTAVAFALVHVPLYGWSAVPLDLAVGIALGACRLSAGSWTAPAVAHVGADLLGWWLL